MLIYVHGSMMLLNFVTSIYDNKCALLCVNGS